MTLVERSTRQTVIAALWEAAGHEALLELLASTPKSRDHELIHAIHEQSVDCRRSAPDFATHLETVAGWLAEIHAGLRAAETIRSMRELLRWQAEAPWRQSLAMEGLLAARAADSGPEAWPWEISRLPGLRAELDQLLSIARGLEPLPVAQRLRQIEAEPRLRWPELLPWLSHRAGLDDPAAASWQRLHRLVASWQRLQEPARSDDEDRLEVAALAEVVELWYRLDPILDRTCCALRAEIVSGQRSLSDALRTVAAGAVEPLRNLHRRAYLLHHVLDEVSVSLRAAALRELAGLAMGPEAQRLGPVQRAIVVQRWINALVLHWRVLDEPAVTLAAAADATEEVLAAVLEHGAPHLVRDLVVARARLLRLLAWWREERLPEAVRAAELALERLERTPDPVVRGRALAELASLLRSRRTADPSRLDRRVRELYDEALAGLLDSVVQRARVLAEYATYLARPLGGPRKGDREHALVLAEHATGLLGSLPPGAAEHPLLRAELAIAYLVLGNVRLEAGGDEPEAQREAAVEAYRAGLEQLGDADEVLAGVLHLDLALVALDSATRHRDDRLAAARDELDAAEVGLRPLPVAHARAVAERAMLAVGLAPDDDDVRREAIREVEAALSRLPVGADAVVRARVQRQLGDLFLGRDGPDDLERAAEQLAAARSAFIEGGAARLAVEVARDYAESQIRQHADEGGPAALTRAVAVLEQAALLAERRWASRRASESTAKLAAMLDGVYGDLAWLRARLERPAEAVLQAACRAKAYRASPGLGDLRARASRSAMLSPAYFDPLARRVPAPPPAVSRSADRGPTPAALRTHLDAFRGANPRALALDLTLTRWGTVVTAASSEGLAFTALSLTRDTVRRWVWGSDGGSGWWARRPGAAGRLPEGPSPEVERAWLEACEGLASDLGRRLLEPALLALGTTADDRLLLLAPGRLTGLPLGAATVAGKALVERVRGLALVPSLTELPAAPIPVAKPDRALCVLGPRGVASGSELAIEELRDVVRLLASAGAEVEVLVEGLDPAVAGSVAPQQGKTRQRVRVVEEAPTAAAVLARAGTIGHVYGRGGGPRRSLLLSDGSGGTRALEPAELELGPCWRVGSSVLLGGGSGHGPERVEPWGAVEALRAAGVGFVVTSTVPVSDAFAHDFCRSFYLYWALGRGIPEACAAALVKVAGSDPSKQGAFVVAMGRLGAALESSATVSTPVLTR